MAAHADPEEGSGKAKVDQAMPVSSEPEKPVARVRRLWTRLATWGVELRGITPIPIEERTDTRLISIFSFWFSMSCNLLPIVTGMSGTLSYELSLRDASLVILFFCLLCAIPPAYLSTFGPKTGLRQMIQARFSFGRYGVCILVLLNLASIAGFSVISSIIGGQTLAAVSSGSVTINAGIVIVAIVSMIVSFAGYKVLHQYERFAWILGFISLVIATGCGGKHLDKQVHPAPATARQVLSFASLIAGFLISWSGMASDFTTYYRPDSSSTRIFWYVYAGLLLPTIPLMVLGAAIGGAIPNVSSWSSGYDEHSSGGALAAMLEPAGGFGKFIVVILALSVIGNVAGSLYSISLNFQMLIPQLVRVPRALFTIVVTAVVIPVSIKAAVSFFDSLENFLGVIGYWAAAYVAVILVEHLLFRKRNLSTYEQEKWNSARKLPTGIAALGAGVLSFGLVIPCMDQIWFAGPIAKTTGDIGFEVAFFVSALLYVPFRALEISLRGL